MAEMFRNITRLINVLEKVSKQFGTLPKMIAALEKISTQFGTLKKAVEVMDKLQKTLENNEGNLTQLITEMQETNKNIKSLLDVIKSKAN